MTIWQMKTDGMPKLESHLYVERLQDLSQCLWFIQTVCGVKRLSATHKGFEMKL